jgi:hypothetical protein
MDYYWQPTSTPKSKTDGRKIIAAIIILIVVISTGLVYVLQGGPYGGNGSRSQVRVAVLDSGIDLDLALQGRVVEQKSFIEAQYGYELADATLTDSRPEGVPHGTMVAELVSETPNTLIVNGKVLSQDGIATSMALVAAIYWAVEQNCSVITMSLGSGPVLGDPLEAAVNWAFSKGVVIVSSAGNVGESGLAGTSISSPSIFDRVISVAAAYENGQPTEFSSTGPTYDRYMKPDIIANGWVSFEGSRYYGTSFASPRVAGAAADLIGYCEANNISFTSGTIMTALMKGATPMSDFPSYVVGTGMLNVQSSLNLIIENTEEGEIPSISLAFPGILPIDYEKLFFGDTYVFNVRLLTSGYTTFDISIESDVPEIFDIPSSVDVNQTLLFPVTVDIPVSGPSLINATVLFSSIDYGNTELVVSFEVSDPIARIAFDISHTDWSIDSYFGQFREFYKELTANDISVTELRNSSATTLSLLQEFDSVVILDPCVYDVNETIPTAPFPYSLPFSTVEKQAYEDYYNLGGGVFVVTLSSSSTNITQVNEFLNWTGFSLTDTEVSSGSDPLFIGIDNLDAHIITSGVNGFHYLGATIQIPVDGDRLAHFAGMPIMAYKEGGGGGRIVVTGSNYLLDNFAFLGEYGPGDDALIALRIVLWTAGLLI